MDLGLEARGGIEPPMMVLQTIALPLGDRATEQNELGSGEGRREKEAFAASSLLCTTNFCRSHQSMV